MLFSLHLKIHIGNKCVILQLTQVQNLANQNMRPPISHHDNYTNKLVEDALFPHQGASPPPHMNNLPTGKTFFFVEIVM